MASLPAIFFLASTRTKTTSSVRILLSGITLLLSPLHKSLVSADSTLMYYFLEEFPPESRVGELINDYGFNKKYNQSVLDQLRFSILMQPNLDKPYVYVEERTGIIRSAHKVGLGLVSFV